MLIAVAADTSSRRSRNRPELAGGAVDQRDAVEPSLQRQHVVDGRNQHRRLSNGARGATERCGNPPARTVVLVQPGACRGDRVGVQLAELEVTEERRDVLADVSPGKG